MYGDNDIPTCLVLVAAKCANIFLYPLQCRQLVPDREIENSPRCSFCPLGETERPKTVVEIDIDNGRPLDTRCINDMYEPIFYDSPYSSHALSNDGAAVECGCGTGIKAPTVRPAGKHHQ